jgi:hypothetical protein
MGIPRPGGDFVAPRKNCKLKKNCFLERGSGSNENGDGPMGTVTG